MLIYFVMGLCGCAGFSLAAESGACSSCRVRAPGHQGLEQLWNAHS